jgi:aspartate/methionine/tyrosine aminotransferase
MEELAAIHEVVRAHGGTLIVDEIYHGLTYGCEARSALEIADDVFVINSFSKYFCMTGWRVGWAVVPEDYVAEVEKLAQNLYISNPEVSMRAAEMAFTPEVLAECEDNRARFQAQRDFLVPALRELGFKIPVTPQGAFYVYADSSAVTDDSYTFCLDLLERSGVAVAPGIDFGNHLARQHVRFSYPKPVPVLQEGVGRIRRHLRG